MRARTLSTQLFSSTSALLVALCWAMTVHHVGCSGNSPSETDSAVSSPDGSPDGTLPDGGHDGGTEIDASGPVVDEHGITWLHIPAGTFEMGCSPNDTDCPADEFPRHTVTVGPFLMTMTEITQAQHTDVIGANPSEFSNCPACPVEEVDWATAQAFCQAVGGRLPSEAEWEYAARGGETTRYYCGHDAACLSDIAWYYDTANGRTQEVAQLEPNAYGLFDVLGNVFEWVADCYHSDYTGAPDTGEVWEGGDCSHHVMRGGCWDGFQRKVRVSNRTRLPPPIAGAVGIRCVRDAR
jgi:formylglycine-generating enzyme required for sulfatase activity